MLQLPQKFTVSAKAYNEVMVDEVGEPITLTQDGRLYYTSVPGEPLDLHEARDIYLAHMVGEIRATGLTVADDDLWNIDSGVFILHFGAYGTHHVLAFGHLENALECAAAHLPGGLFVDIDLHQARADLLASGELTPQEAADMDSDEVSDRVYEHATTDLTYTESGYIASWEWCCTETDLESALEWARNR